MTFDTPIYTRTHTAGYCGVEYEVQTLTAVAEGRAWKRHVWTKDGATDFDSGWQKSTPLKWQQIDFPKIKRNKDGKVISFGKRVVIESGSLTIEEFQSDLSANGWKVVPKPRKKHARA